MFEAARAADVAGERVATIKPGKGEEDVTSGLRSAQIEKVSKTPSRRSFSARDVASNLELVEHLPDGRQKFGQLMGELRIVFRRVCEHHQLFADQVVERALCAEASPDYSGCPALLNPNLLEPHAGNIAL